jgi:asparagine synthase (glutamine-hydrolysing)
MTGVTGGTVTGDGLGRMLDAMRHEDWYDEERFEDDAVGLGALHHGDRDPEGHTAWQGSRAAGVIDGAISNLAELGWDHEDLFERFLDDPAATARAVDGPFVIAAYDAAADRVVVATDKIGCRPCFYATDDGFHFASEVSPLLAHVDDPTVDEQGVSDMILMGNMWSDDTLVAEVDSLHPATVLEYADGDVSRERYWAPTVDPAEPGSDYLYGLTKEFQRSMDRITRTVSGDVGLWLSGGLDSRATLSELVGNYRNGTGEEIDSLAAFVYDANPGGGINPELARQVTEVLEIPLEEVPLTADRFAPRFEESIEITDGMVRWNTLLNLSSVFNIEAHDPGVTMEGLEGALVGHHLCRHHFTDVSSAVESMYRSEAAVSADWVRDVLAVDVDPKEPFRREARRSDGETLDEVIVDAHYRNYYHRLAHASNHLPRSQMGTRVTYADGEFLDYCASLPLQYRMGSAPCSDGELIYGVVKPKITMINQLDRDLAEIPYERSSLKPTIPYPAHVLGFYATTALARLRSDPTYGSKSIEGQWYRNHDAVRTKVNDLVAAACDRPLFDGDALRDLQETHLSGEGSEITTIAAVTTVEQWLQRHFG